MNFLNRKVAFSYNGTFRRGTIIEANDGKTFFKMEMENGGYKTFTWTKIEGDTFTFIS